MSDPISLHVQLGPDFGQRYDAAFARLQKEADAEWIRLVKPYIPKRTGALVGSTDTHTILGNGHIVQATPYAAAQYYRREDGRGPHWGERCANDHREDFGSFVKKRAGEVTK